VHLPRLKRIAPIPILSGTCMAVRTGESSIWPEWHAEPVEAATSCNWPNMSAPILPTNETLRVLGKRRVGWPLSATPSPNGHRAGRPEPNCQKSALGSGATARFVAGAVDNRLKLEASPDIERADAFRGVELVTGDRQHIKAEFAHIGRDFSDRLGCVGVEADSVLPRDCADFRERLDGADFIVGVHDADQQRPRGNGAAHVLWIDQACTVHRKVCDRTADPFDKPAGSENGRMLDGMMCALPRVAAKYLMARLFASLPPLVNTISSGAAPSSFATSSRARSSAAFAGALAQWPLEGLPNASSRNGRMASVTAGSIGVLAL
jgi:hypothetical protein